MQTYDGFVRYTVLNTHQVTEILQRHFGSTLATLLCTATGSAFLCPLHLPGAMEEMLLEAIQVIAAQGQAHLLQIAL
jgi:hypothetical protein